MALNPVLQDLYEAVKIWTNAWKKGQFGEKLDDTPLGKVLDYGLIPYTSPFGINWQDPAEEVEDGEVWPEHFETQQTLLQFLADSVKSDIFLNADNMVLLVDLYYHEDGDDATVIFPSKHGKFFYASHLGTLSRFDKSSKNVGASRTFYNSLKRARLLDTFPTRDYSDVYSEWDGWLDDSGDFYGNYSDIIRDFLSFQFDADNPEQNPTFKGTSLDLDSNVSEFSKVWIVVKKSELLPMFLNWNKQSAQELWNLLSR